MKIFRIFFYFIFVLGVAASKYVSANGEFDKAVFFNLRDEKDFAEYRLRIQELVKDQGKKWKTNQFCVFGVVNDDQSKTAWILWQQGQKIYVWEGEDQAFAKIRGRIDLRKDVVKSEDDLHGSTYLVTRKWVREVRRVCSAKGENIRFSQ